jgi:hypothetical protein
LRCRFFGRHCLYALPSSCCAFLPTSVAISSDAFAASPINYVRNMQLATPAGHCCLHDAVSPAAAAP